MSKGCLICRLHYMNWLFLTCHRPSQRFAFPQNIKCSGVCCMEIWTITLGKTAREADHKGTASCLVSLLPTPRLSLWEDGGCIHVHSSNSLIIFLLSSGENKRWTEKQKKSCRNFVELYSLSTVSAWCTVGYIISQKCKGRDGRIRSLKTTWATYGDPLQKQKQKSSYSAV